MKIREILRSDIIHIVPMFAAALEEQEKDPKHVPYPEPVTRDFSFYLLNQLQARENHESRGLNYPWEMFVAIPQGNVPKGFLEVCINQRSFVRPYVYGEALTFYIDPKCRGKGIIEPLMYAGLEFGKKFGAEAIEGTYVPGSRAHALWARIGFRSYVVRGVFADDNWKPILEEEELKCRLFQAEEAASKGFRHSPAASQTGSLAMSKEGPKDQLDFFETQCKEKEPLTLVKG